MGWTAQEGWTIRISENNQIKYQIKGQEKLNTKHIVIYFSKIIIWLVVNLKDMSKCLPPPLNFKMYDVKKPKQNSSHTYTQFENLSSISSLLIIDLNTVALKLNTFVTRRGKKYVQRF